MQAKQLSFVEELQTLVLKAQQKNAELELKKQQEEEEKERRKIIVAFDKLLPKLQEAIRTIAQDYGYGICGIEIPRFMIKDQPADDSKEELLMHSVEFTGLAEMIFDWCRESGLQPRKFIVITPYGKESDGTCRVPMIEIAWTKDAEPLRTRGLFVECDRLTLPVFITWNGYNSDERLNPLNVYDELIINNPNDLSSREIW